jgi:hypothetical protein
MGSLEHAVETLRAAAPQLQILLLNDVPNCDLDPAHKCSTGSLQGDDDDWFRILDTLGLNKCGFRKLTKVCWTFSQHVGRLGLV